MTRNELGDAPRGGRAARLLIVDDHAAVRFGLIALLEDDPGLTLLPSAAGADEALEVARRQAPDIALLDVSLADGDGLRLCLALKRLPAPPGVLLYTASTDPLLGLKARLVGADGLVGKAASATELRAGIAAVLDGEASPPAFDRVLARAKAEQLAADGVAIVGLRVEGTPVSGIADVLALDEDEVVGRISELLAVLDGDPALDDPKRSTRSSTWSGGLHAPSAPARTGHMRRRPHRR